VHTEEELARQSAAGVGEAVGEAVGVFRDPDVARGLRADGDHRLRALPC
jgi:hypothetical protein